MNAAETHLDTSSRRRTTAIEKAACKGGFFVYNRDMTARRLLFAQALILLGTAGIYVAGLEFFLFWKLWWFDILLHFLGGLWAAVASAWAIVFFLKRQPSLLMIVLSALAIAIGWEVFEYVLGFPREEAYVFDVVLDIVMGVLGGLAGALFARS